MVFWLGGVAGKKKSTTVQGVMYADFFVHVPLDVTEANIRRSCRLDYLIVIYVLLFVWSRIWYHRVEIFSNTYYIHLQSAENARE